MGKKPYYTEFRTIDDEGQTHTQMGPVVWAEDLESVRMYLDENGFHYCKIMGIAEDKINNPENN